MDDETCGHRSGDEGEGVTRAGLLGLQVRLREVRDSCTRTERNIIDYVRTHPERVAAMSVRELAAATYSSTSSVVRVCKAIGLSGYRELRVALLLEMADSARGARHREGPLTAADCVADVISKVMTNSIQSIEDTERLIDPREVGRVARLIGTSARVLLFGMGSSAHVAQDLCLKLLRLDRTCLLQADAHAQLLLARNAHPDDLAIIFSYSGRTSEMIACLRALKEAGATVVAITRLGPSPIAAEADICINVAANESLFRSGAMSSRLAQLAIVDILYTAYASQSYERSSELLRRTHIHKD